MYKHLHTHEGPTLMRQRRGASHICQMLNLQMSATHAPIARRTLCPPPVSASGRPVALVAENTAEPPGVCVDQRRGRRHPGRQAQLAGGRGSHARPERSSGYCARAPMRVASFSSSVSSPIAR